MSDSTGKSFLKKLMSWMIEILSVGRRRTYLLILIDLWCFISVYITTVIFSRWSSTSILLNNKQYVTNCFIFVLVIFVIRLLSGLYTNVWRYANSKVFLIMLVSDFIGGCLSTFVSRTFGCYLGLWQSVTIILGFMIVVLVTRLVYQLRYRYLNTRGDDNNKIGIAIVGAGQVGSFLVEELSCTAFAHYKPICFIDNTKEKIGSRVMGIKVYENTQETLEIIKAMPIQEIFIAIPDLTSERLQELYEFYRSTKCKIKVYDFPFNDGKEINSGKRVVRELNIEDLLFRHSLKISDSSTRSYYENKCVLITGVGSIGSELARQVAKSNPRRLILVDIYENNAYEIQMELKRKYPELNLAVEIASVRDNKRMDTIFSVYRPDIVFHAAAHKHVPLMEHSNCEAIKNNVFGTRNVADLAEKYETKKFILISTDKAVNPTNVMGASKRMCEMVIQCRTDSKTSFSAVRFGNVLGSNGSVIPLFKSQIINGGPVTITDKRVVRYFMTISEASQLVMQAGAMAKRGELFVLDMGKPIKILDLAENMITLAGYKPYRDIDIQEIGLRPGEKLYEELLIKTENLTSTKHELIFIEKDKPLDRKEVDKKLKLLSNAVIDAEKEIESEKIRLAMKAAVDTFRDPDEVNSEAVHAQEMIAASAV